MPHLILEEFLQTSLFPTWESSSHNWDLIFTEVSSPQKGIASSLRHDTKWEKTNIMHRLIFEEFLQTSLFPTRESSSHNWDLVFTEALSPYGGIASSLRHDTNWEKINIMPHLILEELLQTNLFPTWKSSSYNWDIVFSEARSPYKGLASSLGIAPAGKRPISCLI
ncbi:hypothetical protein Adt_29574 [Abeliophyllum distichum]|uniref:Maturase K n=1 Tax=Abeliophyllum distichum TaxID=126358 RepID=A0ABD1R8R8_9LAMI